MSRHSSIGGRRFFFSVYDSNRLRRHQSPHAKGTAHDEPIQLDGVSKVAFGIDNGIQQYVFGIPDNRHLHPVDKAFEYQRQLEMLHWKLTDAAAAFRGFPMMDTLRNMCSHIVQDIDAVAVHPTAEPYARLFTKRFGFRILQPDSFGKFDKQRIIGHSEIAVKAELDAV